MEPPSRDALLARNLASQAAQTKSRSELPSKEPTTSTSPKSDSASRKPASTRKTGLKKVLARRIDIHPLDEEHIKYIWAAYRRGALKGFAESLEVEGLKPHDFAQAFLDHVAANFQEAWVLFAETREGFQPAGFIVAWTRGRVVEIAEMIWFPWATPRNVFEAVVHFMEGARKDGLVVFEYARFEDKRFFERVSSLGVMRKIGHSHSLYPDRRAVIFETMRKQ